MWRIAVSRQARTAQVEVLEFWGMIWQNTHPSPTVYHSTHIPGLCVLPIIHIKTDRTHLFLSFFLSLSLWIYRLFSPSLTLSFSVSLMQPCHYVKRCLSGLFVYLIAADCCVSRTSACILKHSQCGIIRHLTTHRADRPSRTTGNCSQLAWLSSKQRTQGSISKHTQGNTNTSTVF